MLIIILTHKELLIQTPTVHYKAGDNIEMLSGFEVENGGVMHTYIVPCQ